MLFKDNSYGIYNAQELIHARLLELARFHCRLPGSYGTRDYLASKRHQIDKDLKSFATVKIYQLCSSYEEIGRVFGCIAEQAL